MERLLNRLWDSLAQKFCVVELWGVFYSLAKGVKFDLDVSFVAI